MSRKRPRIKARFTKGVPAYWRERLFRNTFTYKGRVAEVRSWSVKIQLFGKRKSFTLNSRDCAQAAGEACQIYQAIRAHGWEAVAAGRSRAGLPARGASASRSSLAPTANDPDYWKQRLIHRRYPESSELQEHQEFSVRIEYARTACYFPLGTSDGDEAAARAVSIYRTVVRKGWASANAGFPRELSVALRWQESPLAWTYTTLHTRLCPGPPKPVSDAAGRPAEHTVVFIEPDAGIRFALAECANSEEGFRCDAAFAGAVEALREIPRRRVDLVLANHDLPDESGASRLDELQRVLPDLAVLSYSVFEDSDQLFQSTPGGSVGYMLKRTPPCRLFEPIAELAGRITREQIASHVRNYFQLLSGLLPSGPSSWKLAKLTPREQEVLALLSKGDLAKEIADTLGISNWTVQGHLKSIFEKLHVHTRTAAVIRYLQK